MRSNSAAVQRPDITELHPEEPARFNPERLEDLCHRIGEVRAEAEVALALHRISDVLPNLPTLLRRDGAAFSQTIEQIAHDAELIGMASLARVARNVLDAHAHSDATAIEATMARLNRVGDRSILAVWDLEDGSV